MEIWKIWLIGIVITIFTSILIHKKAKINRILRYILVVVSIVLVGGILEGWIAALSKNAIYDRDTERIVYTILLIVSSSALLWIVGTLILGISKKNQFRIWEITSFILVYIVASICWSQPFINYDNNIEEINETVLVNKHENKLLYFCNIPVQQVSGSVSGNVSGTILGGIEGEISGSISTAEELPYWYVNENGDGEYNSVPSNNSTIDFIGENEKPYVEVTTYRRQTRTVNHNNGEETIVTEDEWEEYVFYLPQTIMQYPIEN